MLHKLHNKVERVGVGIFIFCDVEFTEEYNF